jgi:hypothetical protein
LNDEAMVDDGMETNGGGDGIEADISSNSMEWRYLG